MSMESTPVFNQKIRISSWWSNHRTRSGRCLAIRLTNMQVIIGGRTLDLSMRLKRLWNGSISALDLSLHGPENDAIKSLTRMTGTVLAAGLEVEARLTAKACTHQEHQNGWRKMMLLQRWCLTITRNNVSKAALLACGDTNLIIQGQPKGFQDLEPRAEKCLEVGLTVIARYYQGKRQHRRLIWRIRMRKKIVKSMLICCSRAFCCRISTSWCGFWKTTALSALSSPQSLKSCHWTHNKNKRSKVPTGVRNLGDGGARETFDFEW